MASILLYRRFLRRLAIGVGVVLGLVAVGFALVRGSIETVRMVTEARPWFLVAAVGTWMVAVGCQGQRWRALIPGARLPVGDVLLWQVGASALAFGLPGPVGEAAAAAIAKQRAGVPFSAAFAASIASRLLGLGLFGLLVLASWPFVRAGAVGVPDVMGAGATVALGAVGVGAFAAMFLPGPMARLGGSVARFSLGPVRGERVDARLHAVALTLGTVARIGRWRWLEAAGWSLAGLVAQVVATWFAMTAVHAGAGLPLTGWLHGMVSVAALAGVVLPAGEVASDAVFIAGFSAMGGVTTGEAVLADAAVRAMRLGAVALAFPAAAWLLGVVGMGVSEGTDKTTPEVDV